MLLAQGPLALVMIQIAKNIPVFEGNHNRIASKGYGKRFVLDENGRIKFLRQEIFWSRPSPSVHGAPHEVPRHAASRHSVWSVRNKGFQGSTPPIVDIASGE